MKHLQALARLREQASATRVSTAAPVGASPSDPKDARAAWLFERLDPRSAMYDKPTGPSEAHIFGKRVKELLTLEDYLNPTQTRLWNSLKQKSVIKNYL